MTGAAIGPRQNPAKKADIPLLSATTRIMRADADKLDKEGIIAVQSLGVETIATDRTRNLPA